MAKKKEVQFMITPEFRVSYPNVFKPRAVNQGDTPYFSVAMLFPKSTDISELKKLCKKAVHDRWGAAVPQGLVSPFKDGDKKGDPNYVGMISVNAKSEYRPGVVGLDSKTYINDASVFYPGCWAKAQVNAYTWDNMGRKGVSIGLNNLQKTKDDEALGASRMKAEDAFTPVEGGDGQSEEDYGSSESEDWL